jgi:hypothetical protein
MKEEIKQLNLPPGVMGFFTDCPECGQETNREGLIGVLEKVYEQGYKQGYFVGREDLKQEIIADFDNKQ